MKARIQIGILTVLSMMSSQFAGAGLRAEEPISTAPIDARQLTRVRFGTYSHWLQPWRGYLETMPATRFLDGLGIVLNTNRGEDAKQMLRMCVANGIRHARIEIGWGSLDYNDETKLHNAKDAAARLLACKAAGIRPLILLNGHHGMPCPSIFFERTAAADAEAGARELMLDKTDGLIVGHSGLSNGSHSFAAEFLITAIEGNRVTLSKPLKQGISAGTKVRMATLKYAPFGDARSDEGRATLEGWKRYARTIATFAAETLDTSGTADLGFDLEIWNEMSFGSCFIHQRYYYEPLPHKYDENAVYLDVVRATAAAAEAEPARFAGVRLENGFSNTLPWPASGQMPARVTALSHHPYAGRKQFPKEASKGTALNALGLPDGSGFTPRYEECFPEYFASALQTETMVRDMAPLATDIYGVKHGRFTRPGNPCWCWITEVNYAPGEDGVTDPSRALRLKAKAISRYFCFYLNKGVERLYLFAIGANDPKQGDLELGVLKQDFVNRTVKEKQYPADDGPWTSPALLCVRRIAQRMRDGIDPGLKETRPIEVLAVEDQHHAKQFEGDPADLHARPPLFDRDVFAFLPFQVNARKFVIPFYVMTRDVRRDLPAEQFTVTIKGLDTKGKFSVYDPILDKRQDVRTISNDGDTVKLELSARDYPALLEVEEKNDRQHGLDPRGRIHMPIGIPDTVDTLRTFVEAEGNFSPGFGTYGIYFWIFDTQSGRLVAPTMAGVEHTRGLARGGYPVPWTAWSAGDVKVTTEVAHVLRPSPQGNVHVAAARAEVRNVGRNPRTVQLYVALRPMGAAGWDVKRLAVSEEHDALLVDSHPAIVSLQKPAGAGVVGSDTVGEAAFRNELPRATSAASATGDCSGALAFDVTLAPGAKKTFALICPVLAGRRAVGHQWDGTGGWFQADLAQPNPASGGVLQPDPGTAYYRGLSADGIFDQALADWKKLLGHVSFQLPDSRWAETFTAINAHIALAMNEGQPDGCAINLNVFNRNAIYSANLFQKAGLTEMARRALDCCLAHPFSGRVAVEADNPGQILWCLGQQWLIVRDRQWLERIYPSAMKLAAMIRYYRTTPPPHYVKARSLEFGGKLPPDQPGEKPADKRQVLRPGSCDGFNPSYTEAFDIAGLRAAAAMARALARQEDARQCEQLAASLMDAYDAKFGPRLAEGYGSYAVLWPCRLYPLERGKAFEQFRGIGAKSPGGWRYFPLATAHQGLLAGNRAAGCGTIRNHFQDPQLRGWFLFDEGGGTGSGGWPNLLPPHVAAPRITWKVGQAMPLDWSLSELALLIRDSLLHEDQERLVLLPGVPAEWFLLHSSWGFTGLPTWFGPCSLTYQPVAGGAVVKLAGDASPPGGYLLRLPTDLHVQAAVEDKPLRRAANGDFAITAGTGEVKLMFSR